VLTFFRDLLIQNRHDDFVALVERYGLALQADSPEIRRVALENFAQMAGWGREPGLLPPEETLLQKILFTHFLRETDQKIQQRSIDALSTFIGHWMTSGRSDRATRALNTLNAGTTAAASNLPWKKQTYEALTTRLSREHVRAMSEQLCTRDLETVAADVYPLLTILGSPAAAELIEQLALEDDRARRGRIVRAIKAIGRPALLPLRHSLESTTWYLVRNTLNLLGDLGAVELLEEMGLTLKHEDSRVRRAAARALSKIGGKRAEELLTAELNTNDGELQTELLFCLGSMKAESSVVALGELMKGRKDEVRERVVDTLGQIGSNQAIPILEDVLRKRALLMGGESAEIRIAAAKALAQINTPEAHLVIRKAVENESNSAAKGQMEKLLNA
jgi:HEAT repeat protein